MPVVGQRADDATLARARRLSGVRTVRVVAPGMMVTADYRSDRLTIDVDADRRIESARCG